MQGEKPGNIDAIDVSIISIMGTRLEECRKDLVSRYKLLFYYIAPGH